LSLDDFGTGYSSLAYLHRLKVSALKIDRGFIQGLEHADSRMLTEVIISLAQKLGLKTVAEGVETEEQLEFVRRHRVDTYQGFLFSRPISTADFERRLLLQDASPDPSQATST
jgi:EAL domain-containing protein (putative c-di-GMP-specific phosphodiesterase class I)